jgi:plasmid stabilization system protein ParE
VKIRYSPRATRDLDAIYEYLIHRSPKGTINVLTAIYASIEFIRRHPTATQVTAVPGVHAMIVRRYRFKIFYRILEAENVLEVVHVRHTSRRSWSGADD